MGIKTLLKGIWSQNLQTKLWTLILFLLNFVLPFFFLHEPAARLILAAALGNTIAALVIVSRFGYKKIISLAHIFWVPLVYYLFSIIPTIGNMEGYDLWVLSVAICNTLALVMDAVDITKFCLGEN